MLDAGYSKSYANGRTVSIEKGGKSRKISPMKHPQVIEYMDEIKAEVIRSMLVRKDETILKTVIVVRDIVDKLELAFKVGLMNREPAAMVQAAMAQAKMLGLIPDGAQTVIPRIEDMNERQLEQLTGKEPATSDDKVH